MTAIKVIDLLPAPGASGKVFPRLEMRQANNASRSLSLSKWKPPHRTLTLRSLFRQFPDGEVPEAYYEFVRGRLGEFPEDALYRSAEKVTPSSWRVAKLGNLSLGNKDSTRKSIRLSECSGTR